MTPLFVYGTLRHLPLLERVVGHRVSAEQIQPASLSGHVARWALGQAFPVLVPEPDQDAEGLLLTGLSPEDMARLEYYEGGFGYHLAPVRVRADQGDADAQVWFPDAGLWEVGDIWNLSAWQARWSAINIEAATEMMAFQGVKSPEEIVHIYPMIMARAASRVAASAMMRGNRSTGSGLTRADVRSEGIGRPYAEFFGVEEHRLSFRRFDGSFSPVVKRAVFTASDAAILLPYDPVQDRVLVIEQFRAGPYARGDHEPWPLEPVAGRVDPGETPEQAAWREAEEEAGLTLRGLENVSRSYPSPGSTSEFFHIFVGLCDLPDTGTHQGGVAAEQEDIRSHILPYTRFLDMLDNDLLQVGPLILAGHWLVRHRERLRAAP